MGSANILNLTEENFAKEVLQSTTPVLVDFYGDYCPPCRALAPILDELAEEYDGHIKFFKVNTEEQPSLAAEYHVSAVPTLLLFQQGQVADQVIGMKSKRDLKARFDRVAV
jgi:thioredoxin 1